MREQLLALASLANGVVAGSAFALRNHNLGRGERYALGQAKHYFRTRAKDAREGKPWNISRMAAMGAASDFAALKSRRRKATTQQQASFFDSIADRIDILLQDPNREDVAHDLSSLFSGVADVVRSDARTLLYQDLEQARQA
jgi:hypothetical protein